MITHEDIAQLFDLYRSFYPDEGMNFPVLTEQLTDFTTDICSRKNFRGHIIADGCVIDPKEKKILMIYHKTLNTWLTPGGHIEASDEHPADTARREVFEETGVRVSPVLDEQQEPLLLHMDSYIIPTNEKKQEPRHWHHGMTFLFLADATLPFPDSRDDGVTGCQWIDIERVHGYERYRVMVDKIQLF